MGRYERKVLENGLRVVRDLKVFEGVRKNRRKNENLNDTETVDYYTAESRKRKRRGIRNKNVTYLSLLINKNLCLFASQLHGQFLFNWKIETENPMLVLVNEWGS